MVDLEKIVTSHRFLGGLNQQHLDKIVGCSVMADFNAGKYIFRQGDKAENFYLLTKGRVTVGLDSPEKETLLVETLNVGDVLGWSWLVPPFKWRFNAVAASATHAIVVNGEQLRSLCEEDHELGFQITKRFLNVIATRLEMANEQFLDMVAMKRGIK
ncbi:MAG: hypothetical protein AUJ71_03350 [Candidatus Omnitrophica bacterium CG1_02_49_16]|nr:MAG: hypothetical protein AUJ71_03350 [Candidatus Omnitrophica bacterium CG1_02_49_16]